LEEAFGFQEGAALDAEQEFVAPLWKVQVARFGGRVQMY